MTTMCQHCLMYQDTYPIRDDKSYCAFCGELMAILVNGEWQRVASKNYD